MGYVSRGVAALALCAVAAYAIPGAVKTTSGNAPATVIPEAIAKVEPPAFDQVALEKQRAEAAKALAGDASGRKNYAGQYEKDLLRKGMSVTITAEGDRSSTLKVSYPLMSKALAFQLSEKAEQLADWRSRGFRQVILTDGFNQSWAMNLAN